MQVPSVAPTPGVFLPKPTTQGSGKGSGWTTIPEKLRSKIFCLAAGDKKADLAAFSRVSRQWRGDAGTLLNLARLHLFANALASVQQPPDSVPVQETSRRIALSLQNPDANHRRDFTNEWLAMTKIPALGQVSPEVFQKFRFLDLNECIKIEAQGYKYGHEWLYLGELYLKAGACDKAQEVVLSMDPKLCYYLIPTLVSDIFIELIGSDSKQWERGMKYVADLPFEQHLIQTVYVLLFQEFIKSRKLPQAVEILQLLEENHIDKTWQLFLAELLIEAGREDLLTNVLLKLKGSFYPYQLKFVFNRWTGRIGLKNNYFFPTKKFKVLRIILKRSVRVMITREGLKAFFIGQMC